jgi:lipid-A-disaccharide synthase
MRRLSGAGGWAIAAQGLEVDIVLPTVPHLDEPIRHGTAAWPVAPRIVVEPEERRKGFRRARAALAKSGTVTLELALAQVPTVLT